MMKECPVCKAQLNDDSTYCYSCGAQVGAAPDPAPVTPTPDPYDHTAEFDPGDISANKVVAMLPYLLDVFGIIIAALVGKDSAYVSFHIRQSLKFLVIETLLGLAAVALAWTFIVPFAALAAIAVITVLRIIAFVQICTGKAKEPAIICKFGFLK